MNLITRQILADGIAEQWRQSRPPNRSSRGRLDAKHESVQRALDALPRPINPNAADAAICAEFPTAGSWTRVPNCSECGKQTIVVVQLGEEPDYESHTAYICRDCLAAAIKLIDASP